MRYFLSYAYRTTSAFGFGNVCATVDRPITSQNDIAGLEGFVMNQLNSQAEDSKPETVVSVHILNWRAFDSIVSPVIVSSPIRA
jgi:hypothetical protein